MFALGLHSLVLQRSLLRKLIAANVMGAGIFLFLIAAAYRGEGPPDAVPHALVLTGLVVSVSVTGLAIVLGERLRELDSEDEETSG